MKSGSYVHIMTIYILKSLSSGQNIYIHKSVLKV